MYASTFGRTSRFLATIALVLVAENTFAQATSEVLTRVLPFLCLKAQGTCFTIDIADKQYVITCRHSIPRSDTNMSFSVYVANNWMRLDGAPILPKNDSVDIVAFELRQPLTLRLTLQPSTHGIQLGQQVYFVGYPSGVLGTDITLAGVPFRIAFIRSAILSAADMSDTSAMIFYLDGVNNPGFSGGPIVWRKGQSDTLRVAAVVSSFRTENFPVLKAQELGNPEAGAFDSLWIRGNSGIVIGYSIEHIVDAIRQHQRQQE